MFFISIQQSHLKSQQMIFYFSGKCVFFCYLICSRFALNLSTTNIGQIAQSNTATSVTGDGKSSSK